VTVNDMLSCGDTEPDAWTAMLTEPRRAASMMPTVIRECSFKSVRGLVWKFA
jgi:hypothetical protein